MRGLKIYNGLSYPNKTFKHIVAEWNYNKYSGDLNIEK